MSTTPELLYGRRAATDVSPCATEFENGGDTVVIENAEILYVLYEMPMQAALDALPVSLHPSIPAVLGITFMRARGGPLGAFELAYAGVACRTGIKPRHFVQTAFCNDPEVARWFGARYGFACDTATVQLRETYDRVRGALVRDGDTLLDVAIADSIPLVGAGGVIKYSPPLCPTRVAGAAALVQLEAAYDFKRVLRGKPTLERYAPAAVGDAGVRPTDAIAGSFAVCDLHLMPARFQVDLEVPAEAGGARRIAR